MRYEPIRTLFYLIKICTFFFFSLIKPAFYRFLSHIFDITRQRLLQFQCLFDHREEEQLALFGVLQKSLDQKSSGQLIVEHFQRDFTCVREIRLLVFQWKISIGLISKF